MTPEITKFYVCQEETERFTVIARWRARIGEFNIREGSLRRYEDGRLEVAIPGYRANGIGLFRGGEVWPALERLVMEQYAWQGR